MTEQMILNIKNNPDRIFFPFLGEDNIFTRGLKIDRVMFTIPGLNIEVYWYGFLITLGIVLAIWYGSKKFIKYGLDPDRVIDCIIGGLVGALVGARLYYVIFSWSYYKDNLLDILKVRDGGLAIYGGLIGALLVGGLIAKIRKLRLSALLDIVGPGFLIGQAIGRWGNFFNQEAYGKMTTLPWGMTSNKIMYELADFAEETVIGTYNASEMVAHPCFLYESLWCLLGFILLHFYSKHRKFDGEVFLMYIGWYGLGRFFIEPLRIDSLMLGYNLRVSQLVAGSCVLIAAILILVFRGNIKRSGEYQFFYQTETSIAQIEAFNMREEERRSKRKNKKNKASQNVEVDEVKEEVIEEVIFDETAEDSESEPVEEKTEE